MSDDINIGYGYDGTNFEQAINNYMEETAEDNPDLSEYKVITIQEALGNWRSSLEADDIETRFSYHTPKPGQPEIYQKLRDKAKELAYMIADSCPACYEKDTAMSRLDEVIMWANASIARRGE